MIPTYHCGEAGCPGTAEKPCTRSHDGTIPAIPQFLRKTIALLPGEEPASAMFVGDPPEGYRWETDAEFRERIKATLAEGAR